MAIEASLATFDIDALLQPVSETHPAGEDIRADFSPTSIYYQIKDARANARTIERQNLISDDPDAINQKVAEWDTVLALAPKILSENSKDLEIAAWYVEALVREHGFAGLRDGFQLVTGLVENFWDDLFPLPDEDGIETRVSPLTGLNGEEGDGTLVSPITQVPLMQSYSGNGFAVWQYEQAYEIETITDPDKKEAKISSGGITMKMIDTAVLETPSRFFVTLKCDLAQCTEVFANLSAILDEKCGDDAPPTSHIRKTLKRATEILGFVTKNIALPSEIVEVDDIAESNSAEASQMSSGLENTASRINVSIESVNINSRDEAFRALLKVADFFKQTEPHSPISYNLNQAVKWGRMSLPELLSELIPDERAREEYFKLAGIPVEETSD